MKDKGRGLDLKRTTIASIVTKETRKITRSTSIAMETAEIRTGIETRMRIVIDVIGTVVTMNVTARKTVEIDAESRNHIRAVDASDQAQAIARVVRVARRVF